MSAKRQSRRRRRWICDPQDEIWGFLQQRHISERNVERLKLHVRSDDAAVRSLAELALEIARVKPWRRRRLQVLASEHWALFVRCVQVLGDGFLDVFPSMFDPQSDWLWERWEQASEEIWLHTHGSQPCRCGSGAPYAACCAEDDEAFAAQLAAEEQERREREQEMVDELAWNPFPPEWA